MSSRAGAPPEAGTAVRSTCPACGSAAEPYLLPWLQRCNGCGLRTSSLQGDAARGWDEEAEIAMAPLRRAAARRLLAALAGVTQADKRRLLDVGCGPGWFLEAAAAAGFAVSGIEPDARLAERARDLGFDVATGWFPAAANDAIYDVVTFNDVFEHLPSPPAALAAARLRLTAGGLLLLNLPSRAGPVYRLSEILARAGVLRPLERMWQKGYESPHLFYYAPADLDRLVAGAGFERLAAFALPGIAVRGLWRRIRAEANRTLTGDLLVYAAALAAVPVLKLLPSDIMVRIYRRL